MRDLRYARIAYDAVKGMADKPERYPWVPVEPVKEVLRWIVMPDELSPGQASYNVELLVDRSREIGAQERIDDPERWSRATPHDLTYYQLTRREMLWFAAAVREQTLNEIRNKEEKQA